MKDFKDSTVAKGAMHSVYEAAGCVGLNRLVAQNETHRFYQLKISRGSEMALIERFDVIDECLQS